MPLTIEPLVPDHLDAAAVLLAARHHRDRALCPELPERYENPAEMRPLLATALEAPRTSGVVALRDGNIAGYLLGQMQLDALSRNVPARSMATYSSWHAVEPADAVETYRQLYAALAPRWLAVGSFSHFLEVPADPAVLEAWFSLGFGQVMTFGLRDTGPVPGERTRAGVEIVQAGTEDLDVVTRLECENLRYHAGPPIFVPWMDEAEEELRAYVKGELANPGAAFFLARQDGRDTGIATFHPGDPAPTRPDDCIHLQHGYTEAVARGGGVGTALLEHGLAWARERGYTFCNVNWFTANLLGARFWTGAGFRPIRYRLARHIDPRIAWAGSTDT
jgi:GNAT superfamily N-acetyltransferase